jgi:carbonic anhydrase
MLKAKLIVCAIALFISVKPVLASEHEVKKSVEPDQAYGWLKNGNNRFVKHHLRKDGQSKADITRLSTGQTPHTIILSCSDSRVPPEVIFDQKLGEIFVIRTAGESLDHAALGSIEYAVDHLGAHLIFVMGHTSCGAVTAALSTLKSGSLGSPNLDAIGADLHPRLKSFAGKKASTGLAEEGLANAKGVAEDLLGRSEIIKKQVDAGNLVIKTGLYHLDSGIVDFE